VAVESGVNGAGVGWSAKEVRAAWRAVSALVSCRAGGPFVEGAMVVTAWWVGAFDGLGRVW
jgi:hypothetical protein